MKSHLATRESQSNPQLHQHGRGLGYLSAAPRVSTDEYSELGGPRAHVLGVIDAFRSLGWDVYPFIVGDRIPRALANQGESKLERSILLRMLADIARLIMGVWHTIKASRELRGNIEWVYERFAVLQSMGWIFQRQGVPWILETNGLLFHESIVERKSIILSRLARIVEVRAYRHCDVLVCVTDALKETILDLAGVSPDKILVIPNGVDTDKFDPVQHTPRRLFDGPTLGFVGGLFKWRRLDVLLNALAEIRSEGCEFNLVVVGAGSMYETWTNQVSELGLRDCVQFVGNVPWVEAPSYIAGFDLGFMNFSPVDAGKMSGSPTKLYEYLAMALPVLSSSFSDAWEMIVPGRNGYIFEADDKEDLKRALRAAYQDRGRWREMGLESRARVVEKASWRARVKQMIAGIEQILEEQDAVSSIRH